MKLRSGVCDLEQLEAAPSDSPLCRGRVMPLSSAVASGGRVMDPLEAFKALVRSAGSRAKAAPPAKFVKKMDEIPSLELSPSDQCRMALTLSEKSLIGKFTGLWPSPKVVE